MSQKQLLRKVLTITVIGLGILGTGMNSAFPEEVLVARNDYNLSPYWSLKKTAGKDFWLLLPPVGKKGVEDEEFVKESGYWFPTSFGKPLSPLPSRISIREIEVLDKKGNNISFITSLSSSFPLKCINRLNDKDTSKPAFTPLEETPYKNVWIELKFLNEKEIKKVVIHQGLKKRGQTLHLIKDFALQECKDNRWEDIVDTRVKDNKSELTELTLKRPIKTERIRLFIHNSGQRFSPPGKISRFSSPLIEQNRPFYFHVSATGKSVVLEDFIPSCGLSVQQFIDLGGKERVLDWEDYKEWKEKHKNFLGFMYGEWGLSMIRMFVMKNKNTLKLPFLHNRNKKDNCKAVETYYKFVKGTLFDDIFGLNCHGTYDHYNLEWGGRMASIELTGCGNPSHQIQVMFARGAARQYSKPWMMLQAYFFGSSYPSSRRNVYWKSGAHMTGPLAGIPISLARRDAYLSYMSGVNFLVFEHWPAVHVQDFDNDGVYGLTKQGEIIKEIYEFNKKHPERSTQYTPIGFLLDYYHGWGHKRDYRGHCYNEAWANVPYTKGDFMVNEVLEELYPSLQQHKGEDWDRFKLCNKPDVFDILIPNPPSGVISQDLLDAYKVIVLLGDIDVDKKLSERLIQYVRGGGTLVLNSSQQNPFSSIRTIGEKPLILKEGNPLVTISQYEKGKIILTTPSYCLDKGNKLLPFFPKLLSELTKEVLPFEIKGDIEYLINKNKREEWLITLINNKGVRKAFTDRFPGGIDEVNKNKDKVPETFDFTRTADVSIYFRISGYNKAKELITEKDVSIKEKGGRYVIETKVSPGDIKIIKLEKGGKLK